MGSRQAKPKNKNFDNHLIVDSKNDTSQAKIISEEKQQNELTTNKKNKIIEEPKNDINKEPMIIIQQKEE